MRTKKVRVHEENLLCGLFIASLERNHAPYGRFLQFYSLFSVKNSKFAVNALFIYMASGFP